MPRQQPPYRPLTEVVAEQHEFELAEVEGTMLGFRFPSYVEGIEVTGYHLHFIDAARERGGHVLDSRSARLRARLDPPTTCTSSCRPGSTSPTPASRRRPTRRWPGPRAASDGAAQQRR